MSTRARVVATVGVLWMLFVGGAALMTLRSGDVTLVHSGESCAGSSCVDQSRPVAAVHTHHELDRMYRWIAVASAAALTVVVASSVVKRRPARTDELEYEVVPIGVSPGSRTAVSSPAGGVRDHGRRRSRKRAPALATGVSVPARNPGSVRSRGPSPAGVAQVGATNG